MRRLATIAAVVLWSCTERTTVVPDLPAMDVDRVSAAAARIDAVSVRTADVGWRRLTELAGEHGRRITGSEALERAVAWAADRMREDGLDDVRLDPVAVPHWVRGAEHARIVRPIDRPLALLALGGSIGTSGTLRARVAAFESLEELEASAARLDHTIVFVNHRMPPFDDAHDDPGYGAGVRARIHAASAAAKRGAMAVLVRSVTALRSPIPHAGALAYDDGVRPIPAAAISTEDADVLAELAHRGPVTVELALGAHTLPDAQSANVIGELRGRERPDEIVLLGAHIDSWDVGPGAADDGAGCVAVLEALRLLRAAGLEPKRTVRAVLFTGEEYLLAGARAYRARYGVERHLVAFETDYGMGPPDAIGVGTPERALAMAPLLPAFGRFGIRRFQPRAFGADVRPMVELGAMAFDLEPDGHHYFDVHHTEADTIDAIRPEDLRRNAGAIALLGYAVSQ